MRTILIQRSTGTPSFVVDKDGFIVGAVAVGDSPFITENPTRTASDFTAPGANNVVNELAVPISSSWTLNLKIPISAGQRVYLATSAIGAFSVVLLLDDQPS